MFVTGPKCLALSKIYEHCLFLHIFFAFIFTAYVLDRKTKSCYKFHTNGLLWSQAYMTCMAEGGYLAIINDDTELAVVREIHGRNPDSIIFSQYKTQFMVGLHDWGQRGRNFMSIHGKRRNIYFILYSSGSVL